MKNEIGPSKIARSGLPKVGTPAGYRYLGWIDFAAGVGYRRDYELWLEVNQANYERGRQFAAEMKRRIGYVPAWKRNELFMTMVIRKLAHGAGSYISENRIFFLGK